MDFEFWAVVAFVFMVAATIVDWPRALAGLIWGLISRYIPYGTLVVPAGIIAISAAAEFIYPEVGRTAQPTWTSFFLGIFSVAGTASSIYITLRNLKDRL